MKYSEEEYEKAEESITCVSVVKKSNTVIEASHLDGMLFLCALSGNKIVYLYQTQATLVDLGVFKTI